MSIMWAPTINPVTSLNHRTVGSVARSTLDKIPSRRWCAKPWSSSQNIEMNAKGAIHDTTWCRYLNAVNATRPYMVKKSKPPDWSSIPKMSNPPSITWSAPLFSTSLSRPLFVMMACTATGARRKTRSHTIPALNKPSAWSIRASLISGIDAPAITKSMSVPRARLSEEITSIL